MVASDLNIGAREIVTIWRGRVFRLVVRDVDGLLALLLLHLADRLLASGVVAHDERRQFLALRQQDAMR